MSKHGQEILAQLNQAHIRLLGRMPNDEPPAFSNPNITDFGKWLRIKRWEYSELLLDMAKKLNTNPAHVSAVEHGRMSFKPEYMEILRTYYCSSDADYTKICNWNTEQQIKIDEKKKKGM